MVARRRHAAGFPGDIYETQGLERDFTNANPMAAQASTITLGGTLDDGDEITVTVNDVQVVVELESSSKSDAADALADALNGSIQVFAFVEADSDSTDTVTLTARLANRPFDVSAAIASTAGTVAVAEDTAAAGGQPIPFGRLIVRDEAGSSVDPYPNRVGRLPSAAGDVTDASKPLCVSLRKVDETGGEYEANTRCAGMHRGAVVVRLADGGEIADGDPVYIGRTSANAGEFFSSSASGTSQLDESIALYRKNLGDGLAVVDVNFR